MSLTPVTTRSRSKHQGQGIFEVGLMVFAATVEMLLERRLYDSNYERLTQSIKRKDKKNMHDVSVVDDTVQLDNKNDTDNDTIIDTDNDTLYKQVTWIDHGPQRINYGD